MTPTSSIRLARAEERDALSELHRRSSSVWEEDREALAAHPDALGIPEAAIDEQRVRVAVGEADEVLGFVIVRDAGNGECELEDLFVDPSVMREGIGTDLVKDALAGAAAAGFQQMAVTAAPRTFAFYESLGFTIGQATPTRFGPAFRLCRPVGATG